MLSTAHIKARFLTWSNASTVEEVKSLLNQDCQAPPGYLRKCAREGHWDIYEEILKSGSLSTLDVLGALVIEAEKSSQAVNDLVVAIENLLKIKKLRMQSGSIETAVVDEASSDRTDITSRASTHENPDESKKNEFSEMTATTTKPSVAVQTSKSASASESEDKKSEITSSKRDIASIRDRVLSYLKDVDEDLSAATIDRVMPIMKRVNDLLRDGDDTDILNAEEFQTAALYNANMRDIPDSDIYEINAFLIPSFKCFFSSINKKCESYKINSLADGEERGAFISAAHDQHLKMLTSQFDDNFQIIICYLFQLNYLLDFKKDKGLSSFIKMIKAILTKTIPENIRFEYENFHPSLQAISKRDEKYCEFLISDISFAVLICFSVYHRAGKLKEAAVCFVFLNRLLQFFFSFYKFDFTRKQTTPAIIFQLGLDPGREQICQAARDVIKQSAPACRSAMQTCASINSEKTRELLREKWRVPTEIDTNTVKQIQQYRARL